MRLPLVFLSSYSQSEKTLYIFYIFLKKGHAHSASDDRFIMKVLVCFVPCTRVRGGTLLVKTKDFLYTRQNGTRFAIPVLCCNCATASKLIVFLVDARVTRVYSLRPSPCLPPLTDELMVTSSPFLSLSPPIVCFSPLFTSRAKPMVYHFYFL